MSDKKPALPIFGVIMPATGQVVRHVHASSKEEALQKANEDYEGANVSVCHQCSSEIEEIYVGMASSVDEVFCVDMDDEKEVSRAREEMRANSIGDDREDAGQ